MEKLNEQTKKVMEERFNHDTLLALATVDGTVPWVRTVDALYEDGCFYVVTYALSNKMQQIAKNSTVAVSGEWFTAHGVGENLGHVRDKKNEGIANKLRAAFAAWYNEGDVNEEDPNTCILCIRLTNGVLCADGKRHEIDFSK